MAEQKTGSAGAYSRLFALGDERVAIIDGMLARQDAADEVAALIQKEWGEFTDVKTSTLVRQLNRYRAQNIVPKLLLAMSAKQTDSEAVGKAYKALVERLDVMAELQDLIGVQKSRLTKALERESLLPVLMSGTQNEIKLLADLLTKLGDIQLETGALKRANKTVSANHQNPDGSVNSVQLKIEYSESEAQRFSDTMAEFVNFIDGEFENVSKGDIPDIGLLDHPEGGGGGAGN